jgi:hypothetical protein
MREAETESARFWVDDDGIVRAVAKAINQTTEQAAENLRVFAELADGTRRPVVIDTSQVKGLSREARGIYSGTEAARIWTACALVVSSSVIARTLGNFIIAVSRPPFPTRMFETVDEALVWARAHLDGRGEASRG